jgi:hypothetical protein
MNSKGRDDTVQGVAPSQVATKEVQKRVVFARVNLAWEDHFSVHVHVIKNHVPEFPRK